MFVLLGALFVGYGQRMQAETLGLLEAALWGLAGGVASGLVSLMLAVKNAGYRWPWRTWPGRRRTGPREGDSEMFWARLFVFGATSLLGAFVAAAAHGQMAGPWPAFIMGVGAAPTVRGILSGVEVTARKDGDKGGGELDAGSS
ncbi:hypothetical protein [Nonomuraea dietziae]|uniref:hypothetical protein n=1 Tax=Nonomuraea dietziae TaxID=65515 RepID=UPI0033D6F67E